MARRMIVLTDGYSDSHTAKTAICVIRYKAEEVVAVLDVDAAGRTSQDLLGVGADIPVVATLAEAPPADTLLVGIAPPGGKIPPHWRPIVLEAIEKGLSVVSGLHDFLNDDPQFVEAARQHNVKLVDVRATDERDVATCGLMRGECLRIHTIANDCSVGKMVAAYEITRGLNGRDVDAKFVATGQTGIMIEGDGCPVDRVISDFVSGAAEKLVLANQHHEVVVVEGQGSLFHPRYSCVTLGLLHGLMPDGLILCYEMGREVIFGMEDFPIPELGKVREFYEAAANIMHPCRVIGVAVNGSKFSAAEVADECRRVGNELGLPACDLIRHGPDTLVDAVLDLRRQQNP
ncbi:MAG: DUF1611 domain-containing protein [Planctomycetes bacterium]|nr:DUF1611 domain-containing protein [Planctomycetota bacterium]